VTDGSVAAALFPLCGDDPCYVLKGAQKILHVRVADMDLLAQMVDGEVVLTAPGEERIYLGHDQRDLPHYFVRWNLPET
jgi:hypothetical protein